MSTMPPDRPRRPEPVRATPSTRIHDPGHVAGSARPEKPDPAGADAPAPTGLVGRIKRLVPRSIRHRVVPPLGHLRSQYEPRSLRVPRVYLRGGPPAAAPAITVVVPSLNYGGYIGSTLSSLLDQQYPELELIVCDGGSEDGTTTVLERERDRLARVIIGDGGQGEAINTGFEAGSGELMAWLNADDISLPGTLNCVARYFDDHPEVDVVYGNRVLLDDGGNDVGLWVTPPHSPDSIQWFDFLPQETLFWRRSIWERAGGIDTRFEYGFDWDMILRFHRAGATFARLPRFLGGFRQHDDQKTRRGHAQAQEELDVIRCAHHERRVTIGEAQARAEKMLLKAGPHHLARKLAWRMPRRSVEVPAAREPAMAAVSLGRPRPLDAPAEPVPIKQAS